MIVCPNCQVGLEDEMDFCPLCKEPVVSNKVDGSHTKLKHSEPLYGLPAMSKPAKKQTWEIVSIAIITAMLVTLSLDWILQGAISWSKFPVNICLIILSYLTVFAFWEVKTVLQVLTSFVIGSLLLLSVDLLTDGIGWGVKLAIPLLFLLNVISVVFLWIFRLTKHKGVNLIGFTIIGLALVCIGIEVIVDLYLHKGITLFWSLIASTSSIIVALVLLFIHYRLKRGRDLYKTFHV